MDIVVTIPKNRLADVTFEEKRVADGVARGETWSYFWTLPTVPRKVETGDRLYFVWDGAVRAWHEIEAIDERWEDESVKVWMKAEIHTLKTPLLMKGFQGFRYFHGREGS